MKTLARSILVGGLMLMVIAAAVGCAGTEWKRSHDDTEEAFGTDYQQCKYEIDLNYQNYPMGRGIGGAMAAGFGDALRKRELMHSCLEARGWSLQKRERR